MTPTFIGIFGPPLLCRGIPPSIASPLPFLTALHPFLDTTHLFWSPPRMTLHYILVLHLMTRDLLTPRRFPLAHLTLGIRHRLFPPTLHPSPTLVTILPTLLLPFLHTHFRLWITVRALPLEFLLVSPSTRISELPIPHPTCRTTRLLVPVHLRTANRTRPRPSSRSDALSHLCVFHRPHPGRLVHPSANRTLHRLG